MKLIPNWRRWYRMASVQANALSIAAIAAWHELPAEMRAALPAWTIFALGSGLLVLCILARLVKQPKLHDEPSATHPDAKQ